MWMCPYCGYENDSDDSIALSIRCGRCMKEKITVEEMFELIDSRISELDEKRALIDDEINQIELVKQSALEEHHVGLDKALTELHDKRQTIDVQRIAAMETLIYSPGVRRIYDDQMNIQDFVK